MRDSRVVRSILAAVLGAALATSGVGAQNVADIVVPVVWSIDQQAKIITAELHLTIVPTCEPEETGEEADLLFSHRCTVDDAIAAEIKKNIEEIWNGYQYRCYDLVVVADVQSSNDPNQTVGKDRLIVRIDQGPAAIRSNVAGLGPPGSAWNSSDPGDRLQPANTPGHLSTWGHPPTGTGNRNLYAHEAGHAMGLEDGYQDVKDANGKTDSQTRADSPEDLMADQANSNVDQSTINLLIERSNQIKPDDIRCDYRIDTIIEWFHFTAEKCETAEGDWDIAMDGQRDIGGGVKLVASGQAKVTLTDDNGTLKGPWNARYRIDVKGIPVSVGGQEGTVKGDGSFAGDLMTLLGKQAAGNWWSQNPYASLSGQAANPSKDLILPVENGAFCPPP